MKRSQIHILIVDDDSTQGKAIKEAFERAGFTATWCQTAVQGLTTAQRQEFQCLIVDCVLPKMNGVDLVEEIVQLNVKKPKVVLMSGILKDKNFIKESTERTQCASFLTKPLNLPELVGLVDDLFLDEMESSKDPALLSLYDREPLGERELLELIESESTLHAFHLPMLLKSMQKTSLSGELTVITSVGDVNSMSFYDGNIFAIRTADKDTFFGGLAVGFGFVTPDEVLAALESPEKKMLGQKLINSFALSPHAINVILEEQLALRLSQCIQNNVVSLQWVPRKFSVPDYALNPTRLDALLDDWLRSKFDVDWIRAMLSLWSAYRIEGIYHHSISGAITVAELMAHEHFKETTDLPLLFRQLLHRDAYFGVKSESQDNFKFLESRLDQLLENHKTQNYFEILGVGEKAKSLELNKAFSELKEYFDPQNLPSGCPPAVMVKCTKVFQAIEEAYKTLGEDTARSKYMILLQNKRSAALFENEPIFKAAIIELQNGHAKEAAQKFQTLLDRKLEFKELRSYRIWAGLKVDRNYNGLTLEQVPPEERHSAPYMMAKGVYHRNKGQIQKALEAFRTAHILDPRLNIARSELKQLMQYLEKNGSSKALMKEVTSVVENLFGKRRGA